MVTYLPPSWFWALKAPYEKREKAMSKFKVGDRVAIYNGCRYIGSIHELYPDRFRVHVDDSNLFLSVHEKQLRRIKPKKHCYTEETFSFNIHEYKRLQEVERATLKYLKDFNGESLDELRKIVGVA